MTPSKQDLLKMLSNNDVTFYIPPFQRNYEWNSEQCEVFLEDVVKTAKSNVNNQIAEHFFGTVTYFQSEPVFGQPTKLILIDGQQRITTTMLLFIAIRDIITDENLKSFVERSYLKNNSIAGDGELKIKLKQVETDWEAYKKLVLGLPLASSDKTAAVYRNYKFFCDELREIISNEGLSVKTLIEKGLSKFSVVTIQLEPEKNKWENPQEIFESMNSLGKPLSLADLIRNYLLLGLSAECQEHLYHNYWLNIEKCLPNQVSNFIRDYMQCKGVRPYPKATENNHKTLYAFFKDLFRNHESEALLRDLMEYASIYACIALYDVPIGNENVDRILNDIRIIGASTTYCFILEILKCWKRYEITDKDVIDILKVLEIYLLRRRLAELTAPENKAIPLWGKFIPDLLHSKDKKTRFFRFISEQESSMRMPNDSELNKCIRVKDFYSFRQLKFLFALAEEKWTKSMPALTDKNLQIEHIMPQTLNEDWIRMLGDDYKEVHGEYVHSIGNLTLIRHNQEMGNADFKTKKDFYENKSGMMISQKYICDQDLWNKGAIESRTNNLIKFVLEDILPIPDYFIDPPDDGKGKQKKKNYMELGLIGKFIKYKDDKSIVACVVSKDEIEYEGKNWAISTLTKYIKSKRGERNPDASVNGKKFWEYNGKTIFDLSE